MRSLAAVALLLALGCSSSGAKGDASASNDTCQAARICALDCADTNCITTCRSRANAAAQAAFDALATCTTQLGQCATLSDINCLCSAQCIMDPPCVDEVAACVGGGTDSVCDTTCH
jgi:hypothetical protein